MPWNIILIVLGIILFILCVVYIFRAIQTWNRDKPNPIHVKPLRNTAIISAILSALSILSGLLIPVPTQCTYAQRIHNYSDPFQCVPGTITIGGSTALKQLVTTAAQNYHNRCPSATINFGSKQGSIQGLQDAEKGYVDIGTSDVIAPSSPEYADLVDHPIAASVFVMIVNPSVHIENLSISQIQNIYNGTYTNWNELNLPPQLIVPYTRDANSGSWATFAQYVLLGQSDNARPAPTATPDSTTTQSSSGNTTQDMINAVENTPGAIGYAASSNSVVEANARRINIVNIDNYSPHLDLASGKYRFWNIEHMYTKSNHTTPLTTAFINYMSNESEIGSLIISQGYIPLSGIVGLLNDHCPI